MNTHHEVSIPNGLAEVAKSRDFITTAEFSRVISKAIQTIRKEHSLRGEAFGVKPIKIGNRLLWSVVCIASLLNKGR
jgi:hypothetical protein